MSGGLNPIADGLGAPSTPSSAGPDGASVINDGTVRSPDAGIAGGLYANDSTINSPANFRSAFPAFNNTGAFPDGMVSFMLGQAANFVNACRWGAATQLGVFLWTAHFLALDAQAAKLGGQGGAPGTVFGLLTNGSVDKVSYTRDVSSIMEDGAGHWGATMYGLRYLRFLRIFGAGPIQVGVPYGMPQGGISGPNVGDTSYPQSAFAWPGPMLGPW